MVLYCMPPPHRDGIMLRKAVSIKMWVSTVTHLSLRNNVWQKRWPSFYIYCQNTNAYGSSSWDRQKTHVLALVLMEILLILVSVFHFFSVPFFLTFSKYVHFFFKLTENLPEAAEAVAATGPDIWEVEVEGCGSSWVGSLGAPVSITGSTDSGRSEDGQPGRWAELSLSKVQIQAGEAWHNIDLEQNQHSGCGWNFNRGSVVSEWPSSLPYLTCETARSGLIEW